MSEHELPATDACEQAIPVFDSERRACLMLRRALFFSKAPAIIAETLDFCAEHFIDEIMWKCDAETFNHGITPLPLVKRYVEVLLSARDGCLSRGITYSINPWVTVKWGDCGRDQRSVHPDFDWRVDITGQRYHGSVCLRSGAWRSYLCEAYRLYATTRPAVLWLEDDYKTFMAGGGCFCTSCLSEFGDLLGERFDRQALLERVLAPGKPDPLRAKWIEFLGAEMVETCRQLERAVHAESPETRLGLMGSWSSDGRWWREAVLALAGPNQPIARPSLAPYVEGRATEFMPDRFDIVKETLCYGPGTQICPELENSTYTPYVKSARMTRLQMVLSQFLGHHAITMNLFDMVGTPIADDPRVGAMLKTVRPTLDALASACGQGGRERGVRMMWPMRLADDVPLRDGEGVEGFRTDGEGWAGPIQGAGLPVVWNDAPVAALTGRVPYAMKESEIVELLSHGVLLDGSAAAALCELGYRHLLGVDVVSRRHRYDQALSAESLTDEAFAGGSGVYIDVRRYNNGDNALFELALLPEARSISTYVDPDEQPLMPATVLFENELGGRVAVHAFDLSEEPTAAYMTWTRKRQLASIIRWLGEGRWDLFVEGGAWMIPFRRDYDSYVLVGIVNCETDDWDRLTITLAWGYDTPPTDIQMLNHSSGWHPIRPEFSRLKEGHLEVTIEYSLPSLDFMALALVRPNGVAADIH